MGDSESRGHRPGAWVGYTAAAWAFAFAVPTFLWVAGVKTGLRTVSRDFTTYTWSNHAGTLAFVTATGVLKIIGGLFALALLSGSRRPRLPLPPRRLTLAGGYALAVALFLYGLQDVVLPILMETHIIGVKADADWYAIRWHLVLWGPYFALWGVWLGLTVHRYRLADAGSDPAAESDSTSESRPQAS